LKSTRKAYGEALLELGKKNKNVVVLDADLSTATMTKYFKEKYPKRFFDMGISEQDMIGTAAGLAIEGKIPFASSFAIFTAGRAYEQIRNSVAYSNLNVKIAGSHSGLTVGEDGASHQSIEDIALMRVIPNIKIFSPADEFETKWAVKEAASINGPIYIRLSRPDVESVYNEDSKFEFGRAICFGEGKDGTIITTGIMLHEALKAKNILKEKNINVRVLDIHTIKPIDKEAIIKSAKETKKITVIEDHSIIGGLGGAVCEVLSINFPTYVELMGVNDEFGQSGKWHELLENYHLTSDDIIKKFL